MSAYHTETIEQHGKEYRVEFHYDSHMGAPWDEHDGHGIVSDWTTRPKAPGERVLNERRGMFRYYDIKASIAKAKAEGWGYDPKLTKGQIAAEAVESDFSYLKAWCEDRWHWLGIIVTEVREDADGFRYDGVDASLWGIESESDTASTIQDLIGEVDYSSNYQPMAA
jgi:hypothetical protein